MEYDHRKFHGNVRRYEVWQFLHLKLEDELFQIDDHNVPSLEQIVDLVRDVREWLHGGGGEEEGCGSALQGG